MSIRLSKLVKFLFQPVESKVDVTDKLVKAVIDFLACDMIPSNLFTSLVQKDAQAAQFIEFALQQETHHTNDRG